MLDPHLTEMWGEEPISEATLMDSTCHVLLHISKTAFNESSPDKTYNMKVWNACYLSLGSLSIMRGHQIKTDYIAFQKVRCMSVKLWANINNKVY